MSCDHVTVYLFSVERGEGGEAGGLIFDVNLSPQVYFKVGQKYVVFSSHFPFFVVFTSG